MKKSIIVGLVCMLYTVTLFSCREIRLYPVFSILNNSADTIRVLYTPNNRYLPYKSSEADTSLPESKIIRRLLDEISPKGGRIAYSSLISREEVLKSIFPKDSLCIFIFHIDTLDKYSLEEVRRGYKIQQRYDLSVKDLEELQWIVPYLPTSAMKDMKMYPSYVPQ